jgi:hypothetical protein
MSENETIARLQARVDALEQKMQELIDIDEIKNLQRIYGYYLDKALWDQVVDCFAEDGSLELAQRGVYIGKNRIKQILQTMPDAKNGIQPGMLMNHMNLQPVVHVDPSGKTARGRWRAFIQTGKQHEKAFWGEGVYENTYVKENGTWKIKTMHWYCTYLTPYDTGWARDYESLMPRVNPEIPPDQPPTEVYDDYPSVYIPPFHYVNPVTGRK